VMLVAFVLTFLGASILNIAAGEPFTAPQVLWIHFLISAPFGVALGFDQETPGLMRLRPRRRGESILTLPVKLTAGLVGVFMAAASLIMLEVGIHHYSSLAIGNSIAFTAFALMLVAAAFECRSETRSILTTDTFNSRRMNTIAAIEVIGAVLATGWGFLNRLLGTVQLTTQQFGVALLCALALLVAWEAAKAIARRRIDDPAAEPSVIGNE
jgi:Ca2+-transporting ATPase